MGVSKRLRYEVLRRDNHTCRYCGLTAGESELTVDHVTPTALGGSDRPDNLVACCKDCNAGKSASNPDAPLVDNVAQDALRWAAAMKRAAEMQLVALESIDDFAATFYELWTEWGTGEGDNRRTFESELPNDWRRTLEIWQRAAVHEEDLRRAIRIAFTKKNLPISDAWKYMCGVIWRQLDERQELAKKILAEQEDLQPAPETAIDESEMEPHAPDGTRWVDGVLIRSDTLVPIRFPKLILLFDDVYDCAFGAKAVWPDVTIDEVLWGHPRYYNGFGDGAQHRMNAISVEYQLTGNDVASCDNHLREVIADGFAEAV